MHPLPTTRAARDVAPGESWAFHDHQTMEEVMNHELLTTQLPEGEHGGRRQGMPEVRPRGWFDGECTGSHCRCFDDCERAGYCLRSLTARSQLYASGNRRRDNSATGKPRGAKPNAVYGR